MNTRHIAAVTVLLAAAVVPVANAVIINVPGDQPTIQAGIDTAFDGDEVVVAPGTYFEAINFLGKAITLRSSDGPELTVIDGTGFFHVVQCVSGEGPDTVLDGFTITGGNADGDFPDSNGGGMLNDNSSPTVVNCAFIGNTATEAGNGMYNEQSDSTVTGCTFSANAGGSPGGAMYNNFGAVVVSGCTFTGNAGIGLYNAGGASVITECTFAANGWGLAGSFGSCVVTDCTFTKNAGNAMGTAFSDLSVTNCMFSGNSASAILAFKGSLTATNCTFVGNSSGSFGGGVYTAHADTTLINCTFVANSVPLDGAGAGMFGGNAINCIFWGNSPDQVSSVTASYSNVQGGWPGTGNIDADPLFVDPDNGDFRFQPGSPCIDAANNIAVPAGITTDLDGNPRFVDDPYIVDTGNGDPPIVDMGAYELCLWDCGGDHDGNVGIVDFLGLLSQWDQVGTTCDFGLGDPGVGINEFLDVLANWGPCP